MNQVSRPMQIALGATLLLVLVWFTVLKPKSADDVAATPAPVTSSSTGAASSSTGKTGSALDQTAYATVGKARKAAEAASADARKAQAQTAESGGKDAASASSSASATKSTAATTPGGTASTATSTAGSAATAAAAKATPTLSRADRVILKIQKDLAARRAVVVLVYSKTGAEDKVLLKTIKSKIDLRGGKVKRYYIPVEQVGRYDGLLAGLSLGQTPSTIVIAPNNEAKVLGGLTSAPRIDRLTSSAILTKPAAAAK